MAPAASKLLLSDNISQFKTVPPNYIRPTYDRPNLIDIADFPVPLVDVQGIKGSDRSRVVKEIGLACYSNGFFQIKNHGIPEDLINSMLSTAKEFFSLPESERLKNYSTDHSKETRLSTSFNVSTEKVSNWRDYLRLHCYPLENFAHDWPSNPPQFREVVAEYSKKVRELALILMEAISESLGLEKDCIIKSLGKQAQHMAVNYYPPCPQPELTYGLPEDLINSMLSAATEFFSLPESKRLKNYSNGPSKETRLSASFNVWTEKVSNWRDYLRLHCYPPENFAHDWPSDPPQFREVVAEYSKKVRELALILMEVISESLGLEKDCIIKSLGKQAQHMAINYYPPCPQPELTYGLPAHKDPNAIIILLQDGVQSGLQVLRNGKWVPVNPIPNTFVVNTGDAPCSHLYGSDS